MPRISIASLRRTNRLPQADLQVQYLSNGFAGILAPVPTFLLNECFNVNRLLSCPTPPPNTQGTMPFAYHNMWAGYFPTFNIALVVGYPIQGSLARGMRGVASEETTQAKILMQGVESALAQRLAMRCSATSRRSRSSMPRVIPATLPKRSTRAKCGSSIEASRRTYLVLKRQVQLEQARGLELQAQTQLNQSIVELQRVDGTILTTNGVNLQTLGTQALAH